LESVGGIGYSYLIILSTIILYSVINSYTMRPLFIFIAVATLTTATTQTSSLPFRIRTITAGVTLNSLSDTTTLQQAIDFLAKARHHYEDRGYVVQTVRIASQHLHQLTGGLSSDEVLNRLQRMDALLRESGIGMAIGELRSGDQYDPDLAAWVVELVQTTSQLNFSLPISSADMGVHHQSIRLAAEVCQALATSSSGGEDNFRFTASANVPSNIPFFPAAFHQGPNSFALGLEYPNLIREAFAESSWTTAEANLTRAIEMAMQPLERIALTIQNEDWNYDGIDTSPAPGLDASIGGAIEALTGKPFGDGSTLSACALITGVIKSLDVKTCGYSGLMLPVIEDEVLAQRASEGRYTVEELLLFSSVSGTGLDVIPIPGNTPVEVIANLYRDVAALSVKYNHKALSARLFPIPGKVVGDEVTFDNPYLTGSRVMEVR
jgi:uncharacterized protein